MGSVRIDCYLSNTDPTTGAVWIIEKGMLELLERMMAELQVKTRSYKPFKKIEKGRLACAKYSQDGDYYRVRIVAVNNNDKVDVHYLDFGNSETVQAGHLLELPKEFVL